MIPGTDDFIEIEVFRTTPLPLDLRHFQIEKMLEEILFR